MRHLRSLNAIWLIAVLLAGCETIGIPQPTAFNDRLAAGYTTVTGVTDAALILAQAGKIDKGDAQNIHDQAVNLKAGLDIVRTLHAEQPGVAEDRLSAVLAGLTALDAYLKTRGSP